MCRQGRIIDEGINPISQEWSLVAGNFPGHGTKEVYCDEYPPRPNLGTDHGGG